MPNNKINRTFSGRDKLGQTSLTLSFFAISKTSILLNLLIYSISSIMLKTNIVLLNKRLIINTISLRIRLLQELTFHIIIKIIRTPSSRGPHLTHQHGTSNKINNWARKYCHLQLRQSRSKNKLIGILG